MYTPHPLPTLEPNTQPFTNSFYNGVVTLFNNIITMLQSIPIVPNSQGLFDRNGNWYPPVVSFYDVLIAFLVLGITIKFIMSLSGNIGMASAMRGQLNK